MSGEEEIELQRSIESIEDTDSEDFSISTLSENMEERKNQLEGREKPSKIFSKADKPFWHNKYFSKVSEHFMENHGKYQAAGLAGGGVTGYGLTGEPVFAVFGSTIGTAVASAPFVYRLSEWVKKHEEWEVESSLEEYKEVEEGWQELLEESETIETDLVGENDAYTKEEKIALIYDRIRTESELSRPAYGTTASIAYEDSEYTLVFRANGREFVKIEGVAENPEEQVETGKNLLEHIEALAEETGTEEILENLDYIEVEKA